MKLQNADRCIRKLTKIGNDTQSKLAKGLFAGARVIYDATYNAAPVVTGNLRNSRFIVGAEKGKPAKVVNPSPRFVLADGEAMTRLVARRVEHDRQLGLAQAQVQQENPGISILVGHSVIYATQVHELTAKTRKKWLQNAAYGAWPQVKMLVRTSIMFGTSSANLNRLAEGTGTLDISGGAE